MVVESLQQNIAAGTVPNSSERFESYDPPSSPPHGKSIQEIRIQELERLKAELAEANAEIRRLKEQRVVSQPPPSPPVRTSSKSNSNSASTPRSKHTVPQPMEKAMKRGNDILYRGHHCPGRTAVPECIASDGHHHFSKKGSNQYAKKYTCTICGFSCSEK